MKPRRAATKMRPLSEAERTALVRDAAEAEEVFGLDELEAYAARMPKRTQPPEAGPCLCGAYDHDDGACLT